MENTLKVTNVLSDPTRFNIYEYIIQHQKPVTVLDIAAKFDIHPNVARLHLSKLEEIRVITSYFQKTGKGGRPSRIYKLSDEVIELNFPHRDYKLLAKIAIETFVSLGEPGKEALYQTGKKYGLEVIKYEFQGQADTLSVEERIQLLDESGTMLGMYPEFVYHPEDKQVIFKIKNCPFKEVVQENKQMICGMHQAFLKGMFEALFTEIELVEEENMFDGCENCAYIANILTV